MGQTSSNSSRGAKFDQNNMKKAICVIGMPQKTKVYGVIKIRELDINMVHITGKIEGLTPGLHGFHIHKCGDLEQQCDSCCAHYNPHNRTHGGPDDLERHVGDLGNIKANEQGIANIDIKDHLVKLSGPYSVIGRSFVIHESKDDLGKGTGKYKEESLKTGNAGKRIGCGVIGISE